MSSSPPRLALVFPGQGSQAVGMGRDFAASSPAAREVFAAADEALGFGLSTLCWEGPAEELQLTANTQPAILAASVAMWRTLAGDATGSVRPLVSAGHSLGEYTALVAAGVLELGDALRLVRRRGELMQRAVPAGEGAMAAILGVDAQTVEDVAAAAGRDGEVCVLANYNAPDQSVIAGAAAAVERAVASARERGARRAVVLPVSAPFHSPLMAPARAGMEPLLGETAFAPARWPVVTNVDALPHRRGDELRQALVAQIDSPVRWVDTVRRMVEECAVDTFLEVGPGRVLSGLIKRIAPDARVLRVGELAELQPARAALAAEEEAR